MAGVGDVCCVSVGGQAIMLDIRSCDYGVGVVHHHVFVWDFGSFYFFCFVDFRLVDLFLDLVGVCSSIHIFFNFFENNLGIVLLRVVWGCKSE